MAISKVGANRALQGYLARRSAEREAELDRAARREEFMMNLLERRKQYLLPELMKRFDGIAEMQKATSSRLARAKTHQFTKEAAAYLESTGQLEGILDRLDKLVENPEEGVSTNAIRMFNEKLVENVPKEKLASAINYSMEIGAMQRPSLDGFMSVLTASTDEELMTAMSEMSPAPMPTGAATNPLAINLLSFTELSPEKRQAARKAIINELAPLLDGTVNAETNTVTWKDPENASRIANNAFERFLVLRNDPFYSGSETELIGEIGSRIYQMKQNNQSLFEIASNPTFDFNYTPSTTPPPGSDDEEESIDVIENNYLGAGMG